jgi:hypothetical protein
MVTPASAANASALARAWRSAVALDPSAIHLASAIVLRDLAQAEITFACSDRALVAAAQSEGLRTAPQADIPANV